MQKECLAIDIGGTKTKMARFQGEKLVPFYHEKTSQDPEEQLIRMLAGINKEFEPNTIRSVGIGCPGPLDPKTGVIKSPPNLPQWDEFALAERLGREVGAAVHIENDATLGALGEAYAGDDKPVENLFYMTISTGIGVGIVHEGRIISGARGLAGECWSFPPALFFEDLETEQGFSLPGENINQFSAGTGMVRYCKTLIAAGAKTSIPKEDVSTYTIIAAWKEGDRLAERVLERSRTTLAAALSFIVTLIDPDEIVLGGGLCIEEEWIVAPIREKLERMLPEGIGKGIQVRRARLWDEAVLYGAFHYAESFGG